MQWTCEGGNKGDLHECFLRGHFYIVDADMLGMHAAFIAFQGAGLATGSVYGFTERWEPLLSLFKAFSSTWTPYVRVLRVIRRRVQAAWYQQRQMPSVHRQATSRARREWRIST